jgi:hypothetical protein
MEDMSLYLNILSWFQVNQSLLILLNAAGFEDMSGQTKDYEIGICYSSAKPAALGKMSKDWLTWNQDSMFE